MEVYDQVDDSEFFESPYVTSEGARSKLYTDKYHNDTDGLDRREVREACHRYIFQRRASEACEIDIDCELLNQIGGQRPKQTPPPQMKRIRNAKRIGRQSRFFQPFGAEIEEFFSSDIKDLSIRDIVGFIKQLGNSELRTKEILKDLTKALKSVALRLHQSDDTSFYWSQQFQKARKAKNDQIRYSLLTQLSDDFRTYATHYAQTIVHEMTIPDEIKSLDPVDVGGVAGGSKYITW